MGVLIERIGEENINKYGTKFKIEQYHGSGDVVIVFDNGVKKKTDYRHFKEGSVISPYCKTVFKAGFIGEGKYKSTDGKKATKIYRYWNQVMKRCYNEDYQTRQPTYRNVTICNEWHNFQNFAEWFENNYYEVDDEKMQLDKDILIKGNKIYSPSTCIFVTQRINNLFTKNDKMRGDFPIGVYFNKSRRKYKAHCNTNNKNKIKYLGDYNTSYEAFDAYKKFKESYIKEVANQYKYKIPELLYSAMYNYVVEIND